MKTIGLLGGMSWESTQLYYQLLNQGVKQQLGGLHSAKVVLYSVDFAEIERLQHRGEWEQTGEILSEAARAIQTGGADFLLICTNTMHKVADQIANSLSIPLLHLADATAEHIKLKGLETVGLLGTRFTMEQDFYVGKLRQHGLQVLIPDELEREEIHRIIYHELCLGKINDDSRNAYRQIIAGLVGQGAEGVILGCTEIGLLVDKEDSAVALFDTTEIHVQAAIAAALAD